MPDRPPLTEIEHLCCEQIHPQALQGIRYFNMGEFFEAHEALELAWKAEDRPVRDLYRGVLQVAVAYHHLCRGNYRGARKMFLRCRKWLEPFPDICQGLDLEKFKRDFTAVEARIPDYETRQAAPPDPRSLPHIHITYQH